MLSSTLCRKQFSAGSGAEGDGVANERKQQDDANQIPKKRKPESADKPAQVGSEPRSRGLVALDRLQLVLQLTQLHQQLPEQSLLRVDPRPDPLELARLVADMPRVLRAHRLIPPPGTHRKRTIN